MNSMPFLISWISIEYLQWEKMGPTQQREDLNLQFIAFLLSPSNRHHPSESFLPLVIPMEQAETNNIWSEAELSRDDDSKDLVFWARSLLLSGQMLAGVREFKGRWRLDYKTEVVKKKRSASSILQKVFLFGTDLIDLIFRLFLRSFELQIGTPVYIEPVQQANARRGSMSRLHLQPCMTLLVI